MRVRTTEPLSDDIHRDLDAYDEAVSQWMQPQARAVNAPNLPRMQREIHRKLRRCMGLSEDVKVSALSKLESQLLDFWEGGDVRRAFALPSGAITLYYRPSQNALYFWRE